MLASLWCLPDNANRLRSRSQRLGRAQIKLLLFWAEHVRYWHPIIRMGLVFGVLSDIFGIYCWYFGFMGVWVAFWHPSEKRLPLFH